jgi:hypothetical protein
MAALPLHWQTIAQLSQQMHRGILSPVDLMEHLLSRVAALDGALHGLPPGDTRACPGRCPGSGAGIKYHPQMCLVT